MTTRFKPQRIDTTIMQRRVYVLPKEMVERIHAYGHDTGCLSEVEAVRRLLAEALNAKSAGNALRRA